MRYLVAFLLVMALVAPEAQASSGAHRVAVRAVRLYPEVCPILEQEIQRNGVEQTEREFVVGFERAYHGRYPHALDVFNELLVVCARRTA